MRHEVEGAGCVPQVNCGGVWTEAIVADHMGEQGFADAFKMHIMTPVQLTEHAMPHLSKNKVTTHNAINPGRLTLGGTPHLV